jgi:hypothetical protein
MLAALTSDLPLFAIDANPNSAKWLCCGVSLGVYSNLIFNFQSAPFTLFCSDLLSPALSQRMYLTCRSSLQYCICPHNDQSNNTFGHYIGTIVPKINNARHTTIHKQQSQRERVTRHNTNSITIKPTFGAKLKENKIIISDNNNFINKTL